MATAFQDQDPQVGLYSRTNMDLKRIVEDQVIMPFNLLTNSSKRDQDQSVELVISVVY